VIGDKGEKLSHMRVAPIPSLNSVWKIKVLAIGL
jgi:hypothetical protein